jgi:hypothetical protein
MAPKRFLIVSVLALLTLLFGYATPAQASVPHQFKIREHVLFGPEGPVLETFTANRPLCPSGTFVDDVTFINVTDTHQTLLIKSAYTCNDGSGTFNATKRLLNIFGDPTSYTVGPAHLTGGTGRYTALSASGIDVGSITNDVGDGVLLAHGTLGGR